MDVCHILLGRPWQYDRKTRRDGFWNRYTLKRDGVDITLAPLDTRQSPDEGSALFLIRVDFENVAKISPIVFDLVVAAENATTTHVPDQVQPLLNEFMDVLLEDIPPGLPNDERRTTLYQFHAGVLNPEQTRLSDEPKGVQ